MFVKCEISAEYRVVSVRTVPRSPLNAEEDEPVARSRLKHPNASSLAPDRIDEAVLALPYLGIHERHRTTPGGRAWKSLDWDAMDRLYGRSMISDPATKAGSVLLPQAGLREAEAAFHRLFLPQN